MASGAVDEEATRQETLELWEKKERAEKRLAILDSGVALGEELQRALALVEDDLADVLAGIDREKLREPLRLVFRRFSV